MLRSKRLSHYRGESNHDHMSRIANKIVERRQVAGGAPLSAPFFTVTVEPPVVVGSSTKIVVVVAPLVVAPP